MAIRLRPKYTTVPAVAAHLGVSQYTVYKWIGRGWLIATRLQVRHYADERERKTARGRWRIYENDVLAFLRRFREGRTVKTPPALWRNE